MVIGDVLGFVGGLPAGVGYVLGEGFGCGSFGTPIEGIFLSKHLGGHLGVGNGTEIDCHR